MSNAQRRQPGSIFTFYSYKGGVGRSMALANVAAQLAKWGKRVLIVDWDLEAPGIEEFFGGWLQGSRDATRGVVDLIEAQRAGSPIAWQDCVITASPEGCLPIDILPAGRDDEAYVSRLRGLDWEQLFSKNDIGNYLELLRDQWTAEYDFVLLDSRTGITDIGGICTIHLPDVVVALFTSNRQSLLGVADVLKRARRGHARLALDRRRLLVVPVPSRDETTSEYKLAESWRNKFAKELDEFFGDWIPRDESASTVLDYLKIPYHAYWSFGERVPVLEEDEPDNPKSLAFAYQPLARLLLAHLDWKEVKAGGPAALEASKLQAQASERAAYIDRLRSHDLRQWERLAKREGRFAAWYRGAAWTLAVLALVMVALLAAELLDVTISDKGSLIVSGRDYLLPAVYGVPSLLFFYRANARRRKASVASEILACAEHQRVLFEAGGRPYGSMPADQAFWRFVTRIERVLKDGRMSYETGEAFDASKTLAEVDAEEGRPSV